MGKLVKFSFKTVEAKRLRNGNLVEITRFFGKNGNQVEWRVRILHKARKNMGKAANDA